MMRTITLTFCLAALLALCIIGILIYQASPGPDGQAILGVTLGRSDGEAGIAFLSGRHLNCTPEGNAPYTSTCTVTIADYYYI